MDAVYQKLVDEFKSFKNIAIAGLSSSGSNPGNFIYEKFEKAGYNVFAVNPNHDKIKDLKCYPSVEAVPEDVEGVVITSPPQTALSIVKDCKKKGVRSVWIHRSFGKGSYSRDAVDYCKDNGINCILGGCPMMFVKADPGHRVFKHVFDWMGKLKAEENIKN